MKYVISDIHGNLALFQEILIKISLKDADELYVLGDMIDRHPHGIEIMTALMRMPNAKVLLGNHEWMMMRALGFPRREDTSYRFWKRLEYMDIWFHNGAKSTCLAWSGLDAGQQERIKAWLQDLPLEYDVETEKGSFKLVHAAPLCLYEKYGSGRPDALEYAVWDRKTLAYLPDVEGRTVLFGHTITGKFTDCYIDCPVTPFGGGGEGSLWVDIDCGAGLPEGDPQCRGRLACVNLNTLEVTYTGPVSAEEAGVLRERMEEG